MLLNRFNFIVWGIQPPEPEHLTNLPGGIPNGRMSAAVLMVPGEQMYFFINAPDGLVVSSTIIKLVDEHYLEVSNKVGDLIAISTPGLTNNQYFGVVTGPQSMMEGYYRLRISSGNDYYYSNRIWYKPTKYEHISALFSFRNRRNTAHIPWELPEMGPLLFRQQLRLKCFAGNSLDDTKVADYTNVFTAEKRVVSIDQHVFYQFTARNIDAIGREGFRAMLAHKDLKVNAKRMQVKTGFSTSTDSAHLANGTFELWDSEFAIQTNC